MQAPRPQRYHNRIKQLRMESGLTQRQLAHVLGYQSVSSLSHLESGRKLPSLTTAMKLEVALQRLIPDIFPGLYNQVRDPVARRRQQLYEQQMSHTYGQNNAR